ncbi:heavy metal-binding domain-containing protein [Adhaeribacter aquaticus]|uniref:heavy metal-binding domain-containing protein n=1 Tax=Adhaeribacter aquaticus TaxID=299567 RepID=UPI000416CC62|nr:heavy metal-binding domain-containing protein [Adhaeribacter aquaticus]
MKKLILFLFLIATTIISEAQTAKVPKTKNEKADKKEVMFFCPVHPDEKSNKEGKCSKCGKTLVKETSQNYKGHPTVEFKTIYSCPMHPGEIHAAGGACSICKMALMQVPVKNYKGHDIGTEGVFICPDHAQVANAKMGSCPVCKKPLVKKYLAPEENNPKNYKGHPKV